MAEVPDTVDAALDALSAPSSDEVASATEGFSAREIAAAGAARALGAGGSGATPEGATGVYCFTQTFTASQFAAVWDEENTRAQVAFFDCEVDDVIIGLARVYLRGVRLQRPRLRVSRQPRRRRLMGVRVPEPAGEYAWRH